MRSFFLRTFTLIEMLVVVAIIGILASMLMPALMKTLDTARMSVCASNFRQVGMGVSLYLNDYNGAMCSTQNTVNPPSESGHTCTYSFLLRPYYLEPATRYVWTDDDKLIDVPLEKCPSDIRKDEAGRAGFALVTIRNGDPRQKTSFYRSPGKSPMLWDNDFYHSSGAYGWYKWWCESLLYGRHGARINFWCLDGHVEARGDIMVNDLWALHTNGYGNF